MATIAVSRIENAIQAGALRKSRLSRLLLALALFFVVPICARSSALIATAPQSEAAPAAPATLLAKHPAFDPAEGLFSLEVVVTDQSGKPVTGLESKDFRLLDDGQPTKVRTFHAFDLSSTKPDPPVELILLVDTLNPAPQQAHDAVSEVERFLRQNSGHLAQPTSIFRLSDAGLSATAQPSTDGNALAASIAHPGKLPVILRVDDDWSLRSIRDSDTKISLFRNLLSLKVLGIIAIAERQKPGRKFLVWAGSGWLMGKGRHEVWENSSFDWIVEFSTRMREAGIALYRVTSWSFPNETLDVKGSIDGVKSAQEAKFTSLSLEVLATQSGGRVLDPTPDMAGAINRCLDDAGAFYKLSFDPPRTAQSDEFHDLIVQIDKPGFAARTRTGYYNQPIYYDQPNLTVLRVTVQQLEQALDKSHHAPDSELAMVLSGMELTERLSSAKLLSWKPRLPGEKAWAALVAVVDASAFLDPPAAEIPPLPNLDLAAQRQLLSRTYDYLSEIIPKLPNFYATRTTIHYQELPPAENTSKNRDPMLKTRVVPLLLHKASSFRETVLYRNGNEVEEGKKPKTELRSLTTNGTFGPILSTVMSDSLHGSLTWSRWEQSESGPRAVFQYAVPQDKSHYEVAHCCLADGDGTSALQTLVGYHGKIAIDPASGAILRITVEADLQPKQPPRLALIRSDIMVEYGAVEIGGGTHICPLRSVSISRGRTVKVINEWDVGVITYAAFETVLGDVSFGDYHMFRSQSRILTGFDSVP